MPSTNVSSFLCVIVEASYKYVICQSFYFDPLHHAQSLRRWIFILSFEMELIFFFIYTGILGDELGRFLKVSARLTPFSTLVSAKDGQCCGKKCDCDGICNQEIDSTNQKDYLYCLGCQCTLPLYTAISAKCESAKCRPFLLDYSNPA